ncbi:MAG: type I methionyl aminopeptidase [Chloroflexota bacterium]
MRCGTVTGVTIKTAEEIEIMREAGRIVAEAHTAMEAILRPGVSTYELDQAAEEVIRSYGAVPAFLGYPKHDAPDFPGTITASINHELVHGIPSKDRILHDGDIISLDTGCHYEGFVGDAARTHAVGEVPQAVQRLIDVTEEALRVGIAASVVGNATRDVAVAIQQYVEGQGYSVARDYTGHGVGREMHEPPAIPNYWVSKKKRSSFTSVKLVPGMTYAIEPMVIAGRAATKELADKWTVITRDKSLCAHTEHTIAITDTVPLILTLPGREG